MTKFVKGFSPVDFIGNDRYVGRQVRRQIVEELNALPLNQCCTAHELLIMHFKKKLPHVNSVLVLSYINSWGMIQYENKDGSPTRVRGVQPGSMVHDRAILKEVYPLILSNFLSSYVHPVVQRSSVRRGVARCNWPKHSGPKVRYLRVERQDHVITVTLCGSNDSMV